MTHTAVKPGYQVTDLGVIPEDWETIQLTDHVKLISGQHILVHHYNTEGIGVPYITGPSDFIGDRTLITKWTTFPNKIAEMNDILVTVKGSGAGSVFFQDIKVVAISRQLMALRSKHEINQRYLFYIFQKIENTLSQRAVGNLIPGLSRADILKIQISLPPLPEQNTIAAALSDVDALITAQEALIAKKRDIKTATMQQLLTGKVRLGAFGQRAGASGGQSEAGVPSGYQQTELGVIPEDWKIEEIKNLANITTGSKNTQDKIESGKYPFFVRSQTVERINSYSFDGEAVLTAGDGVGTGKIFHYINGKFDFHQRVYKISHFNELLDGFYFYTVFSNRFYDRIMSMTAKSSVDSVRMEMIANMLIPLPPVQEQKAIAAVLSDMDAEITTLEAQRDKTRVIKQGMMQELLTGKTRLI